MRNSHGMDFKKYEGDNISLTCSCKLYTKCNTKNVLASQRKDPPLIASNKLIKRNGKP